MSFLRKLFGRGVPEWANLLQPDEYQRFLETIRHDLTARGLAFKVDEGEGVIRFQAAQGTQSLGLGNLLQQCHRTPADRWAELVHGHFDRLLIGTPKASELIEILADDFEQAKQYLKVRLQPGDYASGLGATVSQPVAEDLISVLVYDFPESIASVHPNHVEKWGVPQHDLFALGLRNVWAQGRLEPARIDLQNGAYLDHYEDHENYFGASHALLLHEYFQPLPELGLLVAVPHRHGMVVGPVEGELTSISLRAMFYFVPQLFKQGPGSITPSLYWYRAGTLTQLPYEVKEDESIVFSPPESFQAVRE